jgi:hypothetical protein
MIRRFITCYHNILSVDVLVNIIRLCQQIVAVVFSKHFDFLVLASPRTLDCYYITLLESKLFDSYKISRVL